MTISNPAEMSGKGVDMSPEDLLVSAVGTCYIGTLFKLLEKRRLPVEHVSVQRVQLSTTLNRQNFKP